MCGGKNPIQTRKKPYHPQRNVIKCALAKILAFSDGSYKNLKVLII